MMRVKICGIKTFADAMAAIDAGADALGFVFYEPSPRYISPEVAKEIICALPPFVEKVGLFVHEKAENIDEICSETKITLAQLHWETPSGFTKGLRIPSLPVIRVSSRQDLLNVKEQYCLADAFVEGFGGEGKRLNLSWFNGVDCSRIVLAGGLKVKDLKEVKALGFYGVDVSSGVESTKGVKNHEKIRDFIKCAKS